MMLNYVEPGQLREACKRGEATKCGFVVRSVSERRALPMISSPDTQPTTSADRVQKVYSDGAIGHIRQPPWNVPKQTSSDAMQLRWWPSSRSVYELRVMQEQNAKGNELSRQVAFEFAFELSWPIEQRSHDVINESSFAFLVAWQSRARYTRARLVVSDGFHLDDSASRRGDRRVSVAAGRPMQASVRHREYERWRRGNLVFLVMC